MGVRGRGRVGVKGRGQGQGWLHLGLLARPLEQVVLHGHERQRHLVRVRVGGWG